MDWCSTGTLENAWGIRDMMKKCALLDRVSESTVRLERDKDGKICRIVSLPDGDCARNPFFYTDDEDAYVARVDWFLSGVSCVKENSGDFARIVIGPDLVSEWKARHGKKRLCYNVGVMNERIEINPNVCHGSPVIRGTRVLVSQILGALSGGDSVNDILADYPSITSEDISAVFAFAGSLARFEDIPYQSVLS